MPEQQAAEQRRADGSQTLERGLVALRLLAEAPQGLGASEIADRLGIHRSMAYRLLTTLTRQDFAARDSTGRYRIGLSFFTLAEQVRPPLLDIAQPVLRELAGRLGATACLVVPENEHAVAVAVIEPPGSGPRFSYRVGNRDPLDRGAAGIAMLAAGPALAGEPERVGAARLAGYAVTHEEIVPGTFGIAAPIRTPGNIQSAAVNVITHSRELSERAVPLVVAAAERITRLLADPSTP